jgi:hypothetical protein
MVKWPWPEHPPLSINILEIYSPMLDHDMPFEIVSSRKAVFSAAKSKIATAGGAIKTPPTMLTLMADEILVE